jgi:hypothetical protein
LNKDEIAALLESLCERPFAGEGPFAGDAQERPAAMDVSAGRSAPSSGIAEPSASVGSAADDPGPAAADLAAILSGTATDAQCQAFQEAAMRSSAVRLEAQSALAFLDGIDAAPLAAPAHLVAQVVAAGDAPARAPAIWPRLARSLMGRRAGQLVAACVVMLMAGGLSWSLWQADLSGDRATIPATTSHKAGAPVTDIEPRIAPTPSAPPVLAVPPVPAASSPQSASPEPSGLPGRTASPLLAPPPAILPVAPDPVPAPPPGQASADPCAPRLATSSETRIRSVVEPKAAKPAPSQPQSKTAAAPAPEPGCGVNAGEAIQNPQADRGPVRAAKPAANIGRLDREAPAAGYPPAASAKRPAANTPPR